MQKSLALFFFREGQIKTVSHEKAWNDKRKEVAVQTIEQHIGLCGFPGANGCTTNGMRVGD
jgi:hypothetical protein